MIYIFHPYLTAPVVLIFYLLYRPPSKFLASITIATIFLYFFLTSAIIPWPDFGSYWLIVIYPTIFIVVTISKLYNFPNLPPHVKFNKSRTLLFILNLSFLIFLSTQASRYLNTYKKDRYTQINIDFPLGNGIYYIHQGGTNKITNYHSGHSSKFAIDINRINAAGILTTSFVGTKDTNDFLIFKDTIYSPCNGSVISVIDTVTDHEVGLKKDFSVNSNKIAIDCGSIIVRVLHLYKKSAMVAVSDTVSTGQPIGIVGNSGFSSRPHLHIEAFTDNKRSESVVIRFKEHPYPVRNAIFKVFNY